MYSGVPYDTDSKVDLIPISEWDELTNGYNDTHLKQSALDTVIGKIKNTSNLILFDTKDDKINYILNAKPNPNENKSDFRNKIIERMLMDGECLVLKINDKLYVADSFSVSGSELREKTYKDIVIGDLVMNRYFKSSEVLHFKNTNNKLKRFIKDLDESYAKLFNRLIEVHMRNNQIRIYAEFAQGKKDDNSQQKYKDFLRGMEDKIRNDSVAVIPTQKDWKPNENAQNYESRSIKEVGDLENMYVRQVANILQVPPLLFSGDLADVSQHKDSYIKDCIRPLMQIIADEVNAKYFKKHEYDKGNYVKVNAIHALFNSELEMGNATEKMVGSGVWTIDDILELQGKKRENNIVTTQRYLTKNMAPIREDGTVDDGKSAN